MPRKKRLATITMILSIIILYVQQMSPSPLLGYIGNKYLIYQNDALLNLSVSIIFPSIIAASLFGSIIEQKIGTKALFSLAMIFAASGFAINFTAESYIIFLVGRLLFGGGFGFCIPFFGSAIMNWYTGRQRYFMNTVNGLFPFIGAVMGFGLMTPLYGLLNSSLRFVFGIWAIPLLIIVFVWESLFEKKKGFLPPDGLVARKAVGEKGLYRNLLKRKDIRMLCFAFICDFLCYSYVAIILPTYLHELGGISASLAGLLAAFFFPGIGIFGAVIGGILISKTGLRKPTLAVGQLLKLIGGVLAALGGAISLGMVMCGVALFGVGNALWMPSMYTVPTELDNMNSTRVAAAFSLISSFGFFVGFVGPIVGGWLTNQLMLFSGISDPVLNHVFGLRWSLFIFSLVNIIALVCVLRMSETGEKKTKCEQVTTS